MFISSAAAHSKMSCASTPYKCEPLSTPGASPAGSLSSKACSLSSKACSHTSQCSWSPIILPLQDIDACDEKGLTYSAWLKQRKKEMEKQKKHDAFDPSQPPWLKCVLTHRYTCQQQRKSKRHLDEVVAASKAELAARRQRARADTEKALDRKYNIFPMFGESV